MSKLLRSTLTREPEGDFKTVTSKVCHTELQNSDESNSYDLNHRYFSFRNNTNTLQIIRTDHLTQRLNHTDNVNMFRMNDLAKIQQGYLNPRCSDYIACLDQNQTLEIFMITI